MYGYEMYFLPNPSTGKELKAAPSATANALQDRKFEEEKAVRWETFSIMLSDVKNTDISCMKASHAAVILTVRYSCIRSS